jgi:hypothetical protein
MPEKEPASRTSFKTADSGVIVPPPPLSSQAWDGLFAELCQDPAGSFEILPRSEYIVTLYLGQPMHAIQERAGQVYARMCQHRSCESTRMCTLR